MIRKIALKNIGYKPLNTVLCLALLTFSVSIITLIVILQKDIEEKFQNDLRDIDLVMGAKGSPLQLVLSAVYHVDAPTGNIKLAEAKKIMNSPIVEQAIPLAYGDSYNGYRILGTEQAYLQKYDAELEAGNWFDKDMEAILGANVAVASGLKIGDTFVGTHGDVEGGHLHEDHKYTVEGILRSNHSVIDNLVLTNIPSVWRVHSSQQDGGAKEPSHEKHHHDEEHHESHHHDHPESHEPAHDNHEEKIIADSMDITAVLMNFKTKMALLNMPRTINEQTSMQAVNPGMEINRLFSLIGIGATTLRMIAGGIMLISGFSIFFILYNRMEDRKYELALLRAVGYRPVRLLYLLLWEGIILSISGYFLGVFLSRAGLWFINKKASADFHMVFSSYYHSSEAWIFLLTIGVGILATLLPAIRAMRMNVSRVLAEN